MKHLTFTTISSSSSSSSSLSSSSRRQGYLLPAVSLSQEGLLDEAIELLDDGLDMVPHDKDLIDAQLVIFDHAAGVAVNEGR